MKKRHLFNWNDLVFFIEVSRQKSLAGAARRLSVDHSTVGRRIRELESALNVKLFDRTRGGFELTDQGLKLRLQVESMEGIAYKIGRNIGVGTETTSGVVRVASMEAIGSLYLAPRFQKFNETNPGITIELVTAPNWINLSKREADILISFPPPRGRKLNVEKIGEFSLWLYASDEYLSRYGAPSTVEELHDHRMIDYIDDLIEIDAVRWLSDAIGELPTAFRSTSLIAQFMATSAASGISMLPTFVAGRDPNLKALLTDQVQEMRDIWMTVHQDHMYVQRIKEVAQFLRTIIQEDSFALSSPHSWSEVSS